MNRRLEYRALSSKILAVAVEGFVGDWTAYISPVDGYDHDREAKIVACEGTKLPYAVAKALFPDWSDSYRWRA
jgi:hypothetical protein